MRYRLLITRVQTVERTVLAPDEEGAMAKVRAELERPFGYIGAWKDQGYEVDVLGKESSLPHEVEGLTEAGPLLYDAGAAANLLRISKDSFYRLVASGEIEHVRIGRRMLISRVAMEKFIESHSHTGRG